MQSPDNKNLNSNNFQYLSEKFDDVQILRYQVPQFYELSFQEKLFAYYLSMAAYEGRDIIYDQNYKHNLWIRNALETIYAHAQTNRDASPFHDFENYLKRIWFSNGIHHHYSTNKFYPGFQEDHLREFIRQTPGQAFTNAGVEKNDILKQLPRLIFSETDTKRVELDNSKDLLLNSANNFYEGINQKEAEKFYEQFPADGKSYGLNSKLIKSKGKLQERFWTINGMYSRPISKITQWLKKAALVAPSAIQQKSLHKLIEFYETGSLEAFNAYNLLWLQDSNPKIETINGFIEVYGDPLGKKGSWEGLVMIRDDEMTSKLGTLSNYAAWFEKHSPIMHQHKRSQVQGVSYNVVQVLAEAGDSSPATPIGINLPNADWIREQHGSKSVSLGNIEDAYHEVSKQDGTLEEFYLPGPARTINTYGKEAFKLLVGLHEVIGHGSGQLEEGVAAPSQTLKNHANTLEEARADLVALYFLPDKFLEEQGLTQSHIKTGQAAYDEYITNGLMLQLKRIAPGENLEEAHMRNRQLIAQWVYEKGRGTRVIEQVTRNGKTFFHINDYAKVRELFGELLQEVQRIKSQGDFDAAQALVAKYGTRVNPNLHKEVLQRYARLNQAPYSGFINPRLNAERDAHKKITRISMEFPKQFSGQMMDYRLNFNNLRPSKNN